MKRAATWLARKVPNDVDLSRFTVGVTADRRSEDQAILLRRLGVQVILGPTVRTLPVVEADGLRPLTESIIAAPPDYLVANTGLGIRTWMGWATTWGLEAELREALGQVRIAARGPKASGAVSMAGLEVWWRSPSEQLADVSRHLIGEGVEGQRVVFQLHGDDRQTTTAELRAAGAEVTELPVYHWDLPEDARGAGLLIDMCCNGELDAVTFTAGPAVRNLVELADAEGRAGDLLAALNNRVVAACIGPVCAAVAVEEGIEHPIMPANWRLGSLVKLVGETLAARIGTG